jgi:hypothetical protein
MEGCVGEGQIEFRVEATCKVESSPDVRLCLPVQAVDATTH